VIRRLSNLATALLVPSIVVVAWWFWSASAGSFFYPPLRTIVDVFADTWTFEHFGSDVVPSVYRILSGLLIAIVVGVAAGALLGRVRLLDKALQPTLQFVRAIPAVALIPVVFITLGIGDSGKIALIALTCFFPVALNTIDGVRNVEPLLEDVGQSFRLTRWQRIVCVQLPSAAPQIFAGVRISLSIAIIVGIVTEMTGATDGIGYLTITAQKSFEIPTMWSGMILLGLLGAALNLVFLSIERRTLKWHYESNVSA
jgi:ABC-type nitrate/sulfonate/bicarbonate transport system permease component